MGNPSLRLLLSHAIFVFYVSLSPFPIVPHVGGYGLRIRVKITRLTTVKNPSMATHTAHADTERMIVVWGRERIRLLFSSWKIKSKDE